jgi:hypothetical protein
MLRGGISVLILDRRRSGSAGIKGKFLVRGALALAALVISGCGGGGKGSTDARTQAAGAPANFSSTVDNPFFPLASTRAMVFRGSERDPDTGEKIETRSVGRVLERRARVAGYPVTVVDVREYEDDELVEHTIDWYSQRRDGSVWYMGERIDDYDKGKIVGHEGQWLTGKRDAVPGLFMPADPKAGDAFQQERAPGVAEDRSRVVAVDVERRTLAGRFDGCIKTRDYAPLDRRTEFKYYCRGAGLVGEEGKASRLDLVERR